MLKMICTEKEAIYQTDFKQVMIIRDCLNGGKRGMMVNSVATSVIIQKMLHFSLISCKWFKVRRQNRMYFSPYRHGQSKCEDLSGDDPRLAVL